MKELLKTEVIGNKQPFRVSTVHDHYITELSVQGSPNPNYRLVKLTTKLEKDEELGEEISFLKVSLRESECFSLWLIYSSNITLEDEMSCAYRLGTKDHIRDMALSLREVILKAFAGFPDLP